MPSRKVIFFGFLGAGIITAIILLIVFLVHKASSSQVTINIAVTSPQSKSASIKVSKSVVQSATVGAMISSVLQTSKIIPYNPNEIFWNTISIDQQAVPIQQGQVTQQAQITNFLTFLNLSSSSIPSSLSFTFSYSHVCNPSNKPTCNPCQGQTAVCTETGWQCLNNQTCPNPSELINCCQDNPNGPYASCQNGIVSCGGCPGTINCGDPGCGAIGPYCTATGWVCAPGQTCPAPAVLSTCCTGAGIFASCQNGLILCSTCQDSNPPSCPPDCQMSGLVCGANGKYTCQKGVQCPPADILQSCCPPDTPFASCSGSSIVCSNCSGQPYPLSDPNYEKCQQGTCEGHGWKCTATGWVCLPGQQCPPQNIWSTCCQNSVGPNVPYCDPISNCIKCACGPGYTGCGNMACSGQTPTQCQTVCCPNGTPCTIDKLTGQCICCASGQACNGQCCPDGTVCDSGSNQCVAICGNDSNGNPVTCSASQSCMMIENLDPNTIAALEKEYGSAVRINDNVAYICMNQQGCQFIGNEIASPAIQDNYYPCFSFPDSSPPDPNNPGPGYCTEKDNSGTKACNQHSHVADCNQDANCTWGNGVCQAKQSNIAHCFSKYSDQASCQTDSSCDWRNVLQYMADDPNNWQQIQTEMAVGQNNPLGNYCDPTNGGTSYQRVVVFNGNSACNWDDCWGRVAQPGVSDVVFNPSNGVCVALQNCDAIGNNNVNVYMNNPQTGLPVPNPYQVAMPSKVTASTFGNCNSTSPPATSSGVTYNTSTGRLVPLVYTCAPDPNGSGGQVCVQDVNGDGIYTDSTCGSACTCAPGYTNIAGQCYKNIFTSGDYSDSGFDACNSSPCFSASCSADNNPCNGNGGNSWVASCHGTCGSGCTCDCVLQTVPAGYNYCEYGTGQWVKCTNPNGCVDSTQGNGWGATNTSDSCLSSNDETGRYCSLPK